MPADTRAYPVLVRVAVLRLGHLAFPDAGPVIATRERVRFRFPVVPLAHYRYGLGVRRPDCEVRALAVGQKMAAKLVVKLAVRSFAEKVSVVFGQHGWVCLRCWRPHMNWPIDRMLGP